MEDNVRTLEAVHVLIEDLTEGLVGRNYWAQVPTERFVFATHPLGDLPGVGLFSVNERLGQ